MNAVTSSDKSLPLRVMSPYGLDITAELSDFYGVADLTDLSRQLITHLEQAYAFTTPVLESVHLAHGMAVKLRAGEQRYVLKVVPADDAEALPAKLARVRKWREAGLPVPQIYSTRNAAWSATPFVDRSEPAYLMEHLPGKPAPLSEQQRQATATLLAALHTLGIRDEPSAGERVQFADQWADAADAGARLIESGLVPQAALVAAIERVTDPSPVDGLVWTHIHGDARICHFLFEGDAVSGMIDNDQGAWGERLIDVAYHTISHPNPAQVAQLTSAEIANWIEHYHELLPLTDTERHMLPAALNCALLLELRETLRNFETGRTDVKESDLLRGAELLSQLPTRF